MDFLSYSFPAKSHRILANLSMGVITPMCMAQLASIHAMTTFNWKGPNGNFLFSMTCTRMRLSEISSETAVCCVISLRSFQVLFTSSPLGCIIQKPRVSNALVLNTRAQLQSYNSHSFRLTGL